MTWEALGMMGPSEYPIDLSMTTQYCRQPSGHQRDAARGATEVSAEREPSAGDYFLPDLELQGNTAVRTAGYTGEVSALQSTDEEGEAPTTDYGGMRGISLQEEIQSVVREGYVQFY